MKHLKNIKILFLLLHLNSTKMKTKATLKQIAKELQVSVSTVSKALNDSPEISEQTKTRSRNMLSLKITSLMLLV